MMFKFFIFLTGYESYSQKGQVKKPDPLSLDAHQDDKAPPCRFQMDTDTAVLNQGVNNELQSKVECDASATTCFVENDTVVRQNFTTTNIPDPIEVKLMDIRDFLAKPILITTISWTTGNAFNSNLWATNSITILNSTTAWTHKFEGFGLLRGTLVIRLKLNANPFQSGLLLLHFLPCDNSQNTYDASGGYSAMHNANMITKLQQPHVEINCRDAVAEMRVPYITPSSYYDVKSQAYDWGAFWLDVLSPLVTGASGENAVNISIYAYWEDVELAAPMVPQMSKKISKIKTKVYEAEEKFMDDRPVSSAMSLVAKSAETLSSIPYLGVVTEPVAWAARAIGGVASFFGWSKPQSETPVVPMAKQMLRYGGTSDGNDVAYPLALIQDNKLQTITSKTITDMDEMSWNFLRKVPALINAQGYQWTTAQVSTTPLFNLSVSPYNFVKTGSKTIGAHTASYVTGAPMSILATQFQQWRGSFDMTLKFVKTQYHTGTLQITWTPYFNTTTVPSVSTGVFSLREVVDIRYCSEITLNLPYMVYEPYLLTNTNNTPSVSGRIDIVVVNELRCPENASSTIEFLVYIEGGDDLELAVPGGWGAIGAPFSPQSNNNVEVLKTSGIAESAMRSDNTEPATQCVGERFSSIKQFLNRFSQSYFKTTLPSSSGGKSVIVWPWYNGVTSLTPVSGLLQSGAVGGDSYGFFANAYAFYRGGVRILINQSNTTTNFPIDMSLVTNPQTAAPVAAGYDQRGTHAAYDWTQNPGFIDPNTVLVSGITETDYTESNGYAVVPYYCRTPCSLVVRQAAAISWPSSEGSQPVTQVNFHSENGSLVDYSLYRSFRDDFQLLYFIGFPPYLLSYA